MKIAIRKPILQILAVILYTLSAVPVKGQTLSALKFIDLVSKQTFPNSLYEEFETNGFIYKKNTNPYSKFIYYALATDTSGYSVTIGENTEQYDYVTSERIVFTKMVSILFLGSQKKAYDLLSKQIKESCSLMSTKDDILEPKEKHRVYKRNGVWIRIADGSFSRGVGMYYAIEFYTK